MLIITGAMGGKTSVLAEASDILTLQHIAHAAIDVDALGLAYLPTPTVNDGVMYRNLRSVCNNYASLGVTRFLLARALESRAELADWIGNVERLASLCDVCVAGFGPRQDRRPFITWAATVRSYWMKLLTVCVNWK